MFCFFSIEDVLEYSVKYTEKGNVVFCFEACERVKGKGHVQKRGKLVKGAFKTKGAYQILALIQAYKGRPPPLSKREAVEEVHLAQRSVALDPLTLTLLEVRLVNKTNDDTEDQVIAFGENRRAFQVWR